MKIALGAAKGLAFLHEADRPVIYRDFKASNILLDLVSISPSSLNELKTAFFIRRKRLVESCDCMMVGVLLI